MQLQILGREVFEQELILFVLCGSAGLASRKLIRIDAAAHLIAFGPEMNDERSQISVRVATHNDRHRIICRIGFMLRHCVVRLCERGLDYEMMQ